MTGSEFLEYQFYLIMQKLFVLCVLRFFGELKSCFRDNEAYDKSYLPNIVLFQDNYCMNYGCWYSLLFAVHKAKFGFFGKNVILISFHIIVSKLISKIIIFLWLLQILHCIHSFSSPPFCHSFLYFFGSGSKSTNGIYNLPTTTKKEESV